MLMMLITVAFIGRKNILVRSGGDNRAHIPSALAFHFGAERSLRLGIAWRSSIYQAVSSFAFLYRDAAPYGDLI